MELTYSDRLQLDQLRLEHYLELSGSVLDNSMLIIRPNSSTLAIYFSAEPAELSEQMPDLRLNAGIVLGVLAIAVYCDSRLIATGSTTLRDCIQIDNDYDYQIAQQQETHPMATATATAPTQTTNGTQATATTATIQTIPTLRSLNTLAERVGESAQAIAEQIMFLRTGNVSPLCLVAFDPATGQYMASDVAVGIWVDNRIAEETERLVAERRNELMGIVTGSDRNGAAPAPTEAPAKPKATRTARKPAAKTAKPKAPAKSATRAKASSRASSSRKGKGTAPAKAKVGQ